MEYIKKEELIEGEIYKANNESLTFIMKATKDLNNVINIPSYNEFMKSGNFNGSYLTFINATSEEKHWLETCIKEDKFITFEEAMKTFISEYVELLDRGCRINNNIDANKIYKCSKDNTKSYYYGFLLDDKYRIGFNKNELDQYLKPSTKEAYDAQFVVKEPEFVLPEKWCIKRNAENDKIVTDYINKIASMPHSYLPNNIYNPYLHNNTAGCCSSYYVRENYTEITFDQFKKYVLKEEIIEEKIIEPLPQFKVIETIETITKVENNEGNQFFIGDVVISSNGTIQTIESFNYNKAKTNIIAFTNKQSVLGNGIGIDKIEHYIEPKVDYQILQYKTESGISCKAPFLSDSHQFYMNERCKIYSIKRISDNLIVTVGDDVLSKTCGVPNKILSIELINNKIRLYPRNSFYNLEDILKINNK